MATLILCSESDDASVNLRDSLLRASEWGEEEFFSHGRVVKHLISMFTSYLLKISTSMQTP